MVTLWTTLVGLIFILLIAYVSLQFPMAVLAACGMLGLGVVSWVIGTILKDIFL
jgi:hypothetical protein